MEVKRSRLGFLRRPGRILPPHVSSGFEDISFRQLGVSSAFEVLLEKWKENVLSIIIAGIRGEIDTAKVVAFVTAPAAVDPGTDHESVENTRIVLLDGVVCR